MGDNQVLFLAPKKKKKKKSARAMFNIILTNFSIFYFYQKAKHCISTCLEGACVQH